MDRILTTNDFAKILRLCDLYLQRDYHSDLLSLIETNLHCKPEMIMSVLDSYEELKNIFDTYNLRGLIFDFISEYSEKRIFKLSDEALAVSQKPIEDVTDAEFKITEERLHRLFRALEHNLSLYEKLYKDKVWLLDSSLGRSERITISPTRLFHILGLDEKDFRNNPDGMREFEQVMGSEIRPLMRESKDLYQVLWQMVEKEESILTAMDAGKLKSVINPQKMEMKNYGFERMSVLHHSKGMIFFDKALAVSIARSEGDMNYKGGNIQADLILLSDFIRKYQCEFVFSPYRKYKHTKNALDAESLIIPKDHYEQARLYKGQQASISESARQYSLKDFEYTIRLEDGREEPFSDPKEIITFSDEEKARLARGIIEELPQLDTEHLKALYDRIMGNSNSNTR